MYDIIIIGSGPAGLTAAIYAKRADKNVLVIEKENFGGEITHSPKVENYPGFTELSGSELGQYLVDQAMNLGAELEMDNILSIDKNDGVFTLNGEYSQYESLSVIIASGSKPRRLGLESEEKFIGRGISYCAVCDGPFFKGKNVAVIGGGNSALQAAVMLSEYCKNVTVIQNLESLTGEKRLADILYSKENVNFIYNSRVTDLDGEDTLSSITVTDDTTQKESKLKFDGMFVTIGQVPENNAFKNLCKLDEYGYIISDETCKTETDGLFAAGDCRTKRVRQIVTATADGAVCALNACRYLDELKVKEKV